MSASDICCRCSARLLSCPGTVQRAMPTNTPEMCCALLCCAVVCCGRAVLAPYRLPVPSLVLHNVAVLPCMMSFVLHSAVLCRAVLACRAHLKVPVVLDFGHVIDQNLKVTLPPLPPVFACTTHAHAHADRHMKKRDTHRGRLRQAGTHNTPQHPQTKKRVLKPTRRKQLHSNSPEAWQLLN